MDAGGDVFVAAEADAGMDAPSGADAGSPDALLSDTPCLDGESCNGWDDDCDGSVDESPFDCQFGYTCHSGRCACASDRVVCDGYCVDTRTDANHCSRCGWVCERGDICLEGVCQCPRASDTNCTQVCVDTQSDPHHCGGCDRECVTSDDLLGLCEAGVCVCGADEVRCPGDHPTLVCVDLQSSDQHCGACDRSCGPSEGCRDGACVPR